jgi:hypothetical protein
MFVPDETIECLDDVPGTMLVKGVYTVDRASRDFVFLKEIPGGWATRRFISVSQPKTFSLDQIE